MSWSSQLQIAINHDHIVKAEKKAHKKSTHIERLYHRVTLSKFFYKETLTAIQKSLQSMAHFFCLIIVVGPPKAHILKIFWERTPFR